MNLGIPVRIHYRYPTAAALMGLGLVPQLWCLGIPVRIHFRYPSAAATMGLGLVPQLWCLGIPVRIHYRYPTAAATMGLGLDQLKIGQACENEQRSSTNLLYTEHTYTVPVLLYILVDIIYP